MSTEVDELEKAISNRLQGLATATWPFDGLPLKIEPSAEQSYQTINWLPYDGARLAIGDGASTTLAGMVQIDFLQAIQQSADELTKRMDVVKNAFWANRRSIDAPAGAFIVRFPRMPMPSAPPYSATHRAKALQIFYKMRSSFAV